MNKKIVLASGSPRRKELMRFITDSFEIRVSGADEKTEEGLSPEQTVKALAKLKAGDVFRPDGDEVIVSADTVVALDDTILGKPKDEEDAFRMLKSLSGRTHRVYTGVCIKSAGKETVFAVCSEVVFYPLTDEEIRAYIATGEPADKAGAYGIQGKGCLLVKEIRGDYFNIVGLPVSRLNLELRPFLA